MVAVGDAWACTNPSAGRGMSVGLVQAQRLRDVVRHGFDDPDALVRRYDEVTMADVTPFYRNQIADDRARIAEMAAFRHGTEPPPPDPARVAVMAAAAEDAEVFRGVMETVTCLALPQEVFARPDMAERIARYRGRTAPPVPGPDRAGLVELLR